MKKKKQKKGSEKYFRRTKTEAFKQQNYKLLIVNALYFSKNTFSTLQKVVLLFRVLKT